MENDLDLNLDELDQIDSNSANKLQIKNRYQKLANDNRTLAQEKEAAEAKVKAEAERAASLEKEANFYKTFSQLSSKHPEATNYQEQILERVNKGYDPEEATLAVLAKEGKLGGFTPPAPQVRPQNVEGGSAMTQMPDGDKSLDEMSRNEKLDALLELEKSGDLLNALRAGINRS